MKKGRCPKCGRLYDGYWQYCQCPKSKKPGYAHLLDSAYPNKAQSLS